MPPAEARLAVDAVLTPRASWKKPGLRGKKRCSLCSSGRRGTSPDPSTVNTSPAPAPERSERKPRSLCPVSSHPCWASPGTRIPDHVAAGEQRSWWGWRACHGCNRCHRFQGTGHLRKMQIDHRHPEKKSMGTDMDDWLGPPLCPPRGASGEVGGGAAQRMTDFFCQNEKILSSDCQGLTLFKLELNTVHRGPRTPAIGMWVTTQPPRPLGVWLTTRPSLDSQGQGRPVSRKGCSGWRKRGWDLK